MATPPGQDPGHDADPGFSWADHVAWLVERHGSLSATAERLSALRSYTEDIATIERALRRLRSRGQRAGGAWGDRVLAAFGLPGAVDARARWMGAYHSRFNDLPLPVCRDLVRLWDRPPLGDAPGSRVWLALSHTTCALRAGDHAAAATHLRRARASLAEAPPEARAELLLVQAFLASRNDKASVAALLSEVEPLLDRDMPPEERACLHARWIDQLAYQKNRAHDGASPDYAAAEALYLRIPVDSAPPFALCRRANGLAFARWKQGHPDVHDRAHEGGAQRGFCLAARRLRLTAGCVLLEVHSRIWRKSGRFVSKSTAGGSLAGGGLRLAALEPGQLLRVVGLRSRVDAGEGLRGGVDLIARVHGSQALFEEGLRLQRAPLGGVPRLLARATHLIEAANADLHLAGRGDEDRVLGHLRAVAEGVIERHPVEAGLPVADGLDDAGHEVDGEGVPALDPLSEAVRTGLRPAGGEGLVVGLVRVGRVRRGRASGCAIRLGVRAARHEEKTGTRDQSREKRFHVAPYSNERASRGPASTGPRTLRCGDQAPTMAWMDCRFCGRAVSRRERQPGQALRCACGALVEVPKVQAFSVLPPPCPRCWQPLSPMPLAEGTLHRCPACSGVFAECRAEAAIQRRGEAALAGMSPPEAPPRAVDLQGYARCPLCANLMNRVQFARRSGVLVDVCRDHGTWFDASELERVAAFATELASETPPVDEETRVQETSRVEEEARRDVTALGEQLELLSLRGPTAADRADLSDALDRLPLAVLRGLLGWIAGG